MGLTSIEDKRIFIQAEEVLLVFDFWIFIKNLSVLSEFFQTRIAQIWCSTYSLSPQLLLCGALPWKYQDLWRWIFKLKMKSRWFIFGKELVSRSFLFSFCFLFLFSYFHISFVFIFPNFRLLCQVHCWNLTIFYGF